MFFIYVQLVAQQGQIDKQPSEFWQHSMFFFCSCGYFAFRILLLGVPRLIVSRNRLQPTKEEPKRPNLIAASFIGRKLNLPTLVSVCQVRIVQ
jgi:hypothetical protein